MRIVAVVLTAIVSASAALAQSTAFTFQGSLTDNGQPAVGLHDFRFKLFDAASAGTQIGTIQCVDNLQVAEGRFTALLDFGNQFTSPNQRYIEIEVRRDAGQNCSNAGGFVVLSPRQLITAAPVATHAKSAFGLDAANGSIANAVFVDNAGRVGVGTSFPTHSLHIANPAPTIALQDADSSGASGGQQVGYLSFRDSANSERGWIGYGSAGDPDLSITNARPGGDIVLNSLGSGKVGIGTASPLAALHLRGSTRLDVASLDQCLRMHNGANANIWTLGIGLNTQPIFYLVSPVTGDVLAGIDRNASSGNGTIFADVKNFRAPNPSDLETDIWYCCPEGPEAAMYVRGTARLMAGCAVIELPQHFRDLASPGGMTVQVTPLSAESRGLAVTKKGLDGVVVVELGSGRGDYEFDWRVEAVRKGYEHYEVIRPWMRSDEDESKAWENRMRWIAERRSNGMP